MVFVVHVIGYTQEKDNKKKSPNDYYNNKDFKQVVDSIIKNYGGEETIKGIKYCRADAVQSIPHDNETWLCETNLFCCLTDTKPTLMKYRREDYSKGPKDSKRKLDSGITFYGKEIIQLVSTRAIGSGAIINRLFDAHYPFIGAFTTRLKDADYSVTYKGKQKHKELGKDVYIIELKDNNPETLEERTTTLYYNTSNYLLEAMLSEYTIPEINAVCNQIIVVKEHKSYEIKFKNNKKTIKYISKLAIKSWTKDIPPPPEGVTMDIKASFDRFDESILEKKE
jgi:hypothetical protein